MFDFILDLKDQIGLYFFFIKFFLYFCIGSLLLLILGKLYKLTKFIVKKFNKNFFIDNLKLVFNIILFIGISILIGWGVILYITKNFFSWE